MSATIKLWLMILLVILALGGSVWWLSERLQTAREELASTTAQVESLSASVEALKAQSARVVMGINDLNKRSAENERRIQGALRQNPEWSASPVPPAVADGLCEFANCSPRGDSPGKM